MKSSASKRTQAARFEGLSKLSLSGRELRKRAQAAGVVVGGSETSTGCRACVRELIKRAQAKGFEVGSLKACTGRKV